MTLLGACATTPDEVTTPSGAGVSADELLIVDCALPPRRHVLGGLTYLAQRRPIRTSVSICAVRGGEYVTPDRADFNTALDVWREKAEAGDAAAQTYVGEIYEKGLGTDADYVRAAWWYRRAAAQGYPRASINLGHLYEIGLGVERDLIEAMNLYRQASGLVDGDLEYVSSIEYADREAARARTALLEEEVKSLRDELAVAEARYAGQRAEYERSERELHELRERISALRAETGASIAPDDVAEIERLRTSLALSAATAIEREAELERARRQLADTVADADSADAAVRERHIALTSRLATTEAALAAAREEQSLLLARLRDANLEAEARARADAATIDTLERELAVTESRLEAAPEPLERERLQRQIAEQRAALESARLEQRQLGGRLAALELELDEREAELERRRDALLQLQGQIVEGRTRIDSRDADDVVSPAPTGPSIDIIEPPLLVVRGGPALARAARTSDELIGRVDPVDNLFSFKIDGVERSLEPGGLFRHALAPERGEIELLAVDRAGERTRLRLELGTGTRGEDEGPDDAEAPLESGTGALDPALRRIEFGAYHALIVGNDDYQSLSDLNTATADARAVDRVLRERYGFETVLLLNATRRQMLAALTNMRRELSDNANLIVYYAGHGELDEGGRGYWLPADATLGDIDSWIPTAEITKQIDTIRAKHIMIVADSCYSGTLTRSSVPRPAPDMTPEQRARWTEAMARSKVRTVLSSGGVRPVIDGAPGARHSIFARAFLDELDANAGVLEAYSLFTRVWTRVVEAARALNVEQSPQYSPISYAGHTGGEFLFVTAAGS